MKRLLFSVVLIIAGLVSAQAQYIAPYSGAVSRTNNSKLSDIFSVKDYGAVGNGVADDTAAIQAAITASETRAAPATVWFPCGVYRTVTNTINITKVVPIDGAGASCVQIITASNIPLFTVHANSSFYYWSIKNITIASDSTGTRTSSFAIRITGSAASDVFSYSQIGPLWILGSYRGLYFDNATGSAETQMDYNSFSNLFATSYGANDVHDLVYFSNGSGTGNRFDNIVCVVEAYCLNFTGGGGATGTGQNIGDIVISNLYSAGGVASYAMNFANSGAYRNNISIMGGQCDAGCTTGIAMDGYTGYSIDGFNNGGFASNNITNSTAASSLRERSKTTFGIIAAPSAPAVGLGVYWIDSTDKRFHDINSDNTIGTTVVSSTCASSGLVTGISTAGVFGCATNAPTATTATNANNGATVAVSNSASYFPLFAASSTNGNQPFNLGTGLSFNPSTNVLTTTTFSGALSGNATTATTLATARAIYGNNFDGSAALTQVIASTYGGTGNGFTKFTGPTTAEKTFTLPNSSDAIATYAAANAFTAANTFTLASTFDGAIRARSGAAGSYTDITLGRTTSESWWGIVANAGEFLTGTATGDTVLVGTTNLMLTGGGGSHVPALTLNTGAQVGAPTGGDKGAGTLNIQGTIWTNGTQGIASQTCTVNTASALTLIFTNGLLTGGTCNT